MTATIIVLQNTNSSLRCYNLVSQTFRCLYGVATEFTNKFVSMCIFITPLLERATYTSIFHTFAKKEKTFQRKRSFSRRRLRGRFLPQNPAKSQNSGSLISARFYPSEAMEACANCTPGRTVAALLFRLARRTNRARFRLAVFRNALCDRALYIPFKHMDL